MYLACLEHTAQVVLTVRGALLFLFMHARKGVNVYARLFKCFKLRPLVGVVRGPAMLLRSEWLGVGFNMEGFRLNTHVSVSVFTPTRAFAIRRPDLLEKGCNVE